MKLNLGCGDRYADGWHNVDFESPHRKDETVDLTGSLPWGSETIALAYAGHVLEHLTLDQCHALLTRLRKCMMPLGVLMVVGPDLVRARALADVGVLDVTLDSLIYGASRWSGDEHKWECTAAIITDLLVATGWDGVIEEHIHAVDAMWPVADRRPVWQCAVKGMKIIVT